MKDVEQGLNTLYDDLTHLQADAKVNGVDAKRLAYRVNSSRTARFMPSLTPDLGCRACWTRSTSRSSVSPFLNRFFNRGCIRKMSHPWSRKVSYRSFL